MPVLVADGFQKGKRAILMQIELHRQVTAQRDIG
jgi:hypothetical protein